MRFSLASPALAKAPENDREKEREKSKKDEEIQKKPYPFAEDEGVVFFSIRLATKKEEL